MTAHGRHIKNHLAVTREVAKVQGGDTLESVPYCLAKGGNTKPYKTNID